MLSNAPNPLDTFPRNFTVDVEVANLLPNLLATSRCDGIRETTYDTTDTTDFCPRRLVEDLLRTCYGETGVMDFGLKELACIHVVING